MQAKKKICSGCESLQFIWKSIAGKKYCLPCSQRLEPVIVSKPRSPIKRSNKPIKNISANRIEALKKYRLARDKYLGEHPTCEFPGCSSKEIDLHHKKGRQGSFLTNKKFFCSLCRYHHELIHREDSLGRSLGLLLSRLEK